MHPAQLQPGYRLDRYELLCPLAYGGMASVWLARFGGRLGFERIIVIKMILPQHSQDPRFQEMFLDEARIVSRIEHSNVARILDVGEHQGNYYIAMEWVDGDSLSKIIRAAEARKERVPMGIALRIIADAAAGLNAAHQLKDRDGTSLGVVHRDVSPQNILVANNGATMIIDFGVAKARDRVSQETTAGQLKGKIRYMAPEQALGNPIDHRADIWALGTILYEMFTGSPPYEGVNEVATLHKLTSGSKPPPIPESVPAVIRAVIDGALAYDPEARFSSAAELNTAIEAAIVAIREPTTSAMVAKYTGELLADRKETRRRAVDAALENARQRDLGNMVMAPLPPMPPSTATLPPPSQRVSSPQVDAILANDPASSPSNQTGRALNMSEAPSAPSATSATLGSANIEYYPPTHDGGKRTRQYVAAAAFGVCLAGGTIGIIMIVTTLLRHRSSSEPTTSTQLEAPVMVADAGAAPAIVATATAAPVPLPTEEPTPAPSESAAPATNDDEEPAPTASTTSTTRKDPPPRPTSAPTRKPPPPPVKPRTPPAPPTTSTKVDRGF